MKSLLIDTSRKPAFITLAEDGVCSAPLVFEETKGLSALLFPALQNLLESGEKISYIGVGIGPGSFVGTRTGVTIAKTLSFAWDLPLFSFLSPLAFLPRKEQESFAYIGDAKMGKLFLLQAEKNIPYAELSPPEIVTLEELPSLLSNKDLIISEKPLELDEQPPALSLDQVAAHLDEEFLKGHSTTTDQLKMAYVT